MNRKLPPSAISLTSFLEKDCGFVLESKHPSEEISDGDAVILRKQHFYVRIYHDLNWHVDAASSQDTNDLYDMALLKEQLTGVIDKDELSFDEQAAFLGSHWQEIDELLRRIKQVRRALEDRRNERLKRLFPTWFPKPKQ